MTVFASAHLGDKILIRCDFDGWTYPIRLISEPVACDSGCMSCRAVTNDGRILPVHARSNRLIKVLQLGPGSASELDATRVFPAEHADGGRST